MYLNKCLIDVYFRAKVTYPNGDTFEGSFNDNKKKHGRGIYTWSTAAGSNPWIPEGGYPGLSLPLV